VEATARRVIPALAPLIDGDSWSSEPFIDRGIARAILRDVMERGDQAAPGSCLLIPEFAALEAWLRGFLL
jgi:hypothetical protein